MEKWVTGEPITASKMNQIGDSIDNVSVIAIEALSTANSAQDENTRLKNALTQVTTLTGNPIVITNALAMTPNNITIEITPAQDGVPTPSAPIDINSYSMIALTRTDGTGGNSATRFIDLDFLAGGAVYGGNLAVNGDGSGTLVITHAKALINTTNMSSWSAIIPNGGINRIFYCGLNERKSASGTAKVSWSNAFDYTKATTMAKLSTDLEDGQYGYQSSNKRMGFRDDRFVDETIYETSTEMIAAFLEAHANDYVVYELETPIEIPINIMKLSLLDGENRVSNDCDLPMQLTYYIDKYAEESVNARVSSLEQHFPGTGRFTLGNGVASVNYAVAEGFNTQATNSFSHAEGFNTQATGYASHSEGANAIASGQSSHAEGRGQANGPYSHAEGNNAYAQALCSHAEGLGTQARAKSQHVFGEYNTPDVIAIEQRGNYVEIVGNGNSSNTSNARTLDWYGNEQLAGGLTLNAWSPNALALTPPLIQTWLNNLSREFTLNNTYEIGEYVRKDGALYVCTTAIEEAETWDETKWQSVTFGKEIMELKNKTTELENRVIKKTDFSNQLGSMSGKIENSVIARPDNISSPQQYFSFAPFQNATQLIISKVKSNVFTIGFSTTLPKTSTQLSNVTYHSRATEVSVDTPDTTGYVVIQYYNSTTENPENVTQQEVFDSIKVIGINTPTDTTLTQQYVAADAKKVGEELANLKSTLMYHNPYKCIQWVQNAGTTATGLISSLTVIGSKLFMFKYVTKNTQTTGNKIYTFNSDGAVTVTGNTFTSNIGYVNSVDWNPLTNYLVTPHQPMAGDAEQIYALYLFPNVTEDTRAFDTAANGVVRIDIDMSIFEGSEAVFGQYQLSAVWGPDDLGKGDLLYVISDDSSSTTSGTRRLALLQLGKGNNIFTYGTAVSGVSTTQFNGTFNVVNTWVQSRTAINGISQGSNDLTYWGGKIYELPAPTSTAGFPLMIHSFDDFGATWKTERILIPYRNANGTASKHEKKGIAIYGEHIYIGSQSNGLYVLDRD